MNIQNILDFLKALAQSSLDFDRQCLSELSSCFAGRSASDTLNPEDICQLEAQLSKRYSLISQTILDYTLNATGANECWITLAHQLALYKSSSFLCTLIPQLINSRDAASLYPASKVQDLQKIIFFTYKTQLFWQSTDSLIDPIDGLPLLKVNPPESATHSCLSRPLSLHELRLLSEKSLIQSRSSAHLQDNFTASGLWETINQTFKHHQSGMNTIPAPILAQLFILVETQPDTLLKTPFPQPFIQIDQYLEKYQINPNELYSIPITLGHNTSSLIDIVAHQLFDPNTAHSARQSLFHWLYTQKPTLVCVDANIKINYPLIDQQALLQILLVLTPLKPDEYLQAKILLLRQQLSSKSTQLDNTSTINSIVELLQLHWRRIKNSDMNYMQLDDSKYKDWKQLAIFIAPFVPSPSNWISCLIPGVKHIAGYGSAVHLELMEQQLNDYILNDTNTALVAVKPILDYYGQYGKFRYIEAGNIYKLSVPMLNRLNNTASTYRLRYRRQFLEKQSHKLTPRIRYSTLLKLQHFASATLVARRTLSGRQYTERQNLNVQQAIRNLQVYIRQLEDGERINLLKQRLRFQDREYSFSHWLKLITADSRCLLEEGHGLLQLLVDYIPILEMQTELEENYNLVNKRHYSLKLYYRNENPEKEELTKNIKQLYMAILLGCFGQAPWVLDSHPIPIWDKIFHVPSTILNFYRLIENTVCYKDYSDLQLKLSLIEIEGHKSPSYPWLVSILYAFYPKEHEKIVRWCTQLQEGKFYNQQINPWFNLNYLLSGMLKYLHSQPDTLILCTLMDNICHTVCNDAFGFSDHLIEIRLNILLRQYLERIEIDQRKNCLALLFSINDNQITDKDAWIKSYLQWRVPQLKHGNRGFGLFKQSKPSDLQLEKCLMTAWLSNEYCPKTRISVVRSELKACNYANILIESYLEDLAKKIPIVSGDKNEDEDLGLSIINTL